MLPTATYVDDEMAKKTSSSAFALVGTVTTGSEEKLMQERAKWQYVKGPDVENATRQ